MLANDWNARGASRWHPGHSANTATHRVNVRIERSRAPPIGQTPSSAGSRSRSLCRIVTCRPIPRSLRSTRHLPPPTRPFGQLQQRSPACNDAGSAVPLQTTKSPGLVPRGYGTRPGLAQRTSAEALTP